MPYVKHMRVNLLKSETQTLHVAALQHYHNKCPSGSKKILFPCLIRFNINSGYKISKPSNLNCALLGVNKFVSHV